MARALNFTIEEKKFKFDIQKIDRSKLYGYTTIDVKDENGSSCNLASISDDGLHILSKGCVGYITMTQDKQYIANNKLKITDAEGTPLERLPSSFDQEIELKPSSIQDLLMINVKSVYQLNYVSDESDIESELIEQLKAHKVLEFKFNYRADYSQDQAFMIHSADGIFILMGHVNPFEFIGLEQQTVEVDDVDDEEDDFDFGML